MQPNVSPLAWELRFDSKASLLNQRFCAFGEHPLGLMEERHLPSFASSSSAAAWAGSMMVMLGLDD